MRPKAIRTYENDRIKVIWKPEKCVYSGNCVKGLPKVFDARRRPWVDVTAADAAEIMRVIDTCPSGALSYEQPNRGGSVKSRRGKNRQLMAGTKTAREKED